MIYHSSIPLPKRHWCYMPTPNLMIDEAESELIMLGCSLKGAPRVLEIGTHKGGTTNNMAKVVSALKGHVVTVDVLSNPDTIPEVQRGECLSADEVGSLVEDKFRSCVTQLLVDPKTDYYKEIQAYAPFDFVFFDGDHSYDGVVKDVLNISPMMQPWGIRMFHDVWWDAEPPPVDGPLKFFDEAGGYVMNFSHVGILSKEEIMRLGGN
jgi:predicted O-methyltransferase YrrM